EFVYGLAGFGGKGHVDALSHPLVITNPERPFLALSAKGDSLAPTVGLVSRHGHGHPDAQGSERPFIECAAALAIRYRDTDMVDWHKVSPRQDCIETVTREHGRSSYHWRRPGWQRSRVATRA